MQMAKPTMDPAMLIPLLVMFLGFTVMFAALLLVRLRAEILNRERTASWIREAVAL
jgi:heme exporter protein C